MLHAHSDWRQSLQSFKHPRVLSMLFFGFSAGVPLLLIFSSLSLWLREAGVERSTVTYFSWAALAYSFKFLWAPLIDRLPLPLLTRVLGRRRAWLLVSQVAVMLAIALIAMINPVEENALNVMALAVVLLGFSSATQDIVIDAYRIESVGVDLQALMSSTYIAGYRIGMLVSGAGALVLASHFGSAPDAYSYEAWRLTYFAMSLVMLVGLLTTLLVSEPTSSVSLHQYSSGQYLRFLCLFVLSVALFVLLYAVGSEAAQDFKTELTFRLDNAPLANFLIEAARLLGGLVTVALFIRLVSFTPLYEKQLIHDSYVEPVQEFFQRYGVRLALLLLVFVGFYRISDIVLGVISNVFFQDMGFTKTEIASVVKTFGLFMTIAGGFLGGVLSVRYGVIRMLYAGAILTVLTNLLFMLLAQAGHNIELLYLVISADNLTAGLASAAFIAFLSSLTNVSFTAVQYAVFSSLMTLLPKVIGGYSGSMVDNLGYSNFFLIASCMGLPVLLLIYGIQRHAEFRGA
ncbi:MFS transporter [Oleiphilus sp. HI0071]|uniref:AmpG family muropeptide MFS transporter n=2 Tax=Oleiphilus TaxID=141450 RepID=UPI0007C22CCB|nr:MULTISPECIES: MFS transporter [unclassified Oleiphilus]KZY60128.1 MFS transporter [Oleiphilus sp. HI0065]KZY84334.1 MFS transporter [Oleiphilus sp. HI0071]KZZ02434.1 MFS transporter [Oleiphilus sp. HI0073]KZZ44813.1 MFS transporter [Oleiphilus sp. HI0118]KZZ50312.1 MFS transporter [Oleiphilus sp. HI0122]KZZ76407.1 MFS transporter [Oleiphilus sp. HI0130]KZZ78889.1 MFS transporter [Oleiphilus sp. HI0133]